MLINITGSSNLGIHEVNEACNLIREAAQNHDVQINFGVVMDEKMADEVKITVIATGFQHETMTDIEQRDANFPFNGPIREGAENGVHADGEMNGASGESSEAAAAAEAGAGNDFDTPAYLRKQKRLVQ